MNYGFARVEEAQIVSSRWQVREDGYKGERFDGLVKSIKEHGIINPLKAFLNEEGVYELVTGHRRLAAARKAGETEIPIDLMTDLRNLPEGTAGEILGKYHQMVIVDNLHHEDLTPIEEGRGIQVLMGVDLMNQEEVGKVLGKSQQWVSDRLSLLKLAPEIQQAVTARAVETSVAQKLSRLPEDVQPAVMQELKGETSRRASNVIKLIKEALEPGFWDLPADQPWRPEWMNVKRAVDYLLEQARTLTPDKMGDIIAALHRGGLLQPPHKLVMWRIYEFARICGLKDFKFEAWFIEQGFTCDNCIWKGASLEWECSQEKRKTCKSFMSEDDPVRLTIPLSDEQCGMCKEEHGWCTDVGCYIERSKAEKAEEDEALSEHALEREMEAEDLLRKFYERQQAEEIDAEHWLAQACRHCQSWRGPENKDPCGHEDPVTIRISFWQGPVIVPRCTGYRLRDLSRIPEVSQSSLGEIMVKWLSMLQGYGGGYGTLNWLWEGSGKKLTGFLKEAELTQRQLGALVTMAFNDRSGGPDLWDSRAVKLMDPVTGEYTKWKLLREETEEEEVDQDDLEEEGERSEEELDVEDDEDAE